MADAPDLGSGAFGHGGSSPFSRTMNIFDFIRRVFIRSWNFHDGFSMQIPVLI